MKKKQFKRFIAWGFTVLAVFLIASFSVPVRSFADSFSVTFVNNLSVGAYGYPTLYFSLLDVNTSSWVFTQRAVSHGSTYSVNLDSSHRYGLRVRIATPTDFNGNFNVVNSYIYYNNSNANHITLVKNTFSNINLYYYPPLTFSSGYGGSDISDTDIYYFQFVNVEPATPTPDPTPTPTPTPTPSPTQNPSITTDNEFWGKLNQNANGAWSFITQVFQGLFNNVLFRNLAIYLPLIGLIIGLVVYLFTMGGRND